MRRVLGKSIENVTRTVGIDSEYLHHDSFYAHLFDLGGTEAIRKMLWQNYAQLAKAIIYVFDGADSKRFEEAYASLIEALSWIEADIPIAIVLNKCDLPDFASQSEIVSQYDLETTISQYSNHFRIFEMSVLENCGISPALEWMIESINEINWAAPVKLQAARVFSLEPYIVLAEVGKAKIFDQTLEIMTSFFNLSLENLKYMPLTGGNYLVSCSSARYHCLAIFYDETTPPKALAFAEFFLEIVEQKIRESGQPFPQLDDEGNRILANLQAIPLFAP